MGFEIKLTAKRRKFRALQHTQPLHRRCKHAVNYKLRHEVRKTTRTINQELKKLLCHNISLARCQMQETECHTTFVCYKQHMH